MEGAGWVGVSIEGEPRSLVAFSTEPDGGKLDAGAVIADGFAVAASLTEDRLNSFALIRGTSLHINGKPRIASASPISASVQYEDRRVRLVCRTQKEVGIELWTDGKPKAVTLPVADQWRYDAVTGMVELALPAGTSEGTIEME